MEEVAAATNYSPSWAELLGSDHWRGLLDPLELSLRELVLRCGDFCQVTYDSFVSDVHSKYCGVVFGSPQVGNRAFDERLHELPGLRVMHVKNKIDLIPLYPSPLLGFVDTRTELVVDSQKSPHLKDSRTPGDWHNLQGILHFVARWNGEHGAFELRVM